MLDAACITSETHQAFGSTTQKIDHPSELERWSTHTLDVCKLKQLATLKERNSAGKVSLSLSNSDFVSWDFLEHMKPLSSRSIHPSRMYPSSCEASTRWVQDPSVDTLPELPEDREVLKNIRTSMVFEPCDWNIPLMQEIPHHRHLLLASPATRLTFKSP